MAGADWMKINNRPTTVTGKSYVLLNLILSATFSVKCIYTNIVATLLNLFFKLVEHHKQ